MVARRRPPTGLPTLGEMREGRQLVRRVARGRLRTVAVLQPRPGPEARGAGSATHSGGEDKGHKARPRGFFGGRPHRLRPARSTWRSTTPPARGRWGWSRCRWCRRDRRRKAPGLRRSRIGRRAAPRGGRVGHGPGQSQSKTVSPPAPAPEKKKSVLGLGEAFERTSGGGLRNETR